MKHFPLNFGQRQQEIHGNKMQSITRNYLAAIFKSFHRYGLLSILFCMPLLQALIDFEDDCQDFVLSTQKIDIPGYPQAFNPSLICWQEAFLLSFRHIPDAKFPFVSRIGLVWLDENFSPCSPPQLLDTQACDPCISALVPPRSEDARLVQIGKRLYMVYSDNKNQAITKGGFRVYTAEVEWDGLNFALRNIKGLFSFPLESQARREKNWSPFEFEGQIFLAYSLQPHRIFRPILGTDRCESFSLSDSLLAWPWGELRGGSPGLLVGNCHLSFFHSSIDMASVYSKGKTIAHYFMGAYTFESQPPFAINAISKEPIVGKRYYRGAEYKPFWKPVRCIFPGGYVFDDDYIWIAYGRQDHEIWITKLSREGLLKSLTPVTTNASAEN